MLIGGAGNDAIDGGAQDDLIFGDNVELDRTLGDIDEPALPDALRHAALQPLRPRPPGANADTSGAAARPTASRATYRDPNDVPWWAEYDVTNLWHDFAPIRRSRSRRRTGPAASATTTSPAAPGNDLDLRPARQRHDPGRRLDRLRRAPADRDTTTRTARSTRRTTSARAAASRAYRHAGRRLPTSIGALDALPVLRGVDRRRGLHRGQRRQRPRSSAASARTTSSAAARASSA